jgi:hypothetical protein
MDILIEELTPNEANLITESSVDGKDTWLSGIFMQADIKNRNGRVYPVNEINAACTTAQQRIKESKGLMGELDHPQSLTINLDRVSHVITEMNMNGSNAYGKAKVLATPMGNIAKELAKAGVSLGVSSRGAGSVNESGGVSQFQFVTVDIVAQPSAPNAYPSTVYESLMEAKNGGEIMHLSEAMKQDTRAQEYFKKEITKWLNENIFMKR